MTRDEIQVIVHETLTQLGIDPVSPIELQRDMAFVRDMRTSTEKAKSKSFLTILVLLVTAAVVWLYHVITGWDFPKI